MHAGSAFYATISPTLGTPKRKRFKDWYYDPEFFFEAAPVAGLDVTVMPDWRHPSSRTDTMLRFTLRP